MSSTSTLVTLLRPWIRRFTIIISAWWLRTSSKFTWEEVKTSTGKLGKWSTPKRVRIRPKGCTNQSINQSILMPDASNTDSGSPLSVTASTTAFLKSETFDGIIDMAILGWSHYSKKGIWGGTWRRCRWRQTFWFDQRFMLFGGVWV